MKKNVLMGTTILIVLYALILSSSSLALIPGDFNSDGKIDFEDLMIFALAYGSSSSDDNWNTLCDLEPDNKIDFEDLMIFAMHYGEEEEIIHLEGTTGENGVASFILEDSQEIQVQVVDVDTKEPIPNINSYLVTDGTNVAYLFVDPAGDYLPRIASEEQSFRTLVRSPQMRIVGTIKELWNIGKAQFSGYEPKFADQIDNQLLRYMFESFFVFCYPSKLGDLYTTLDEFFLEFTGDTLIGEGIELGILAIGYEIPYLNIALLILSGLEAGNTYAYDLWVNEYISMGYSLEQNFEVWRINTNLVNPGASVIPFVFPIEEPLNLPSSDHEKIVFSSDRDGNYDIWMMNPDGSGQEKIIDTGGNDGTPRISPDGLQIAFQSDVSGNNEIYLIGVDRTNLVNLTNNGANDYRPAFSPDGSQIAFMSDRSGKTDIWLISTTGGTASQVTDLPVIAGSPCFSPDGQRIVFKHRPSNPGNSYGNDLYEIDLTTNEITQLTSMGGSDDYPCYSHDGSQIVFTHCESNWKLNIYIMDADGSNIRKLTETDSYEDVHPWFSPDDSQIVFRSARDGNLEIYTMDANGNFETNISNNSSDDNDPSWGECQF